MKRVHLIALLALSWTSWSAQACTTNADCDDGNVCNGSEICQAGVCLPGTKMTCADDNPCTIDTCDPINGCTFTPANGCLLDGKNLVLGTRGDPRLLLRTAPQMAGIAFPANNTDDDPVLNGASLRVFTTNGDKFDNTYPLPAAAWTYRGAPGQNAGYRYKDWQTVNGPITVAYVRNGRQTKIKARGQALNFSLSSDPEPVWIVLRFGNQGRRYCLEFGGRTGFRPGARFVALTSSAPTACPTP